MNNTIAFFRMTWFRLSAWLLVLSGLVLGLVFGVQMLNAKLDTERTSAQARQIYAESLGVVVENWVGHISSLTKSVASQPDLQVTDAEEQVSVLENFARANSDVYIAFTLDSDGQALARSDARCSLRLPGCGEYLAVSGADPLDLNYANQEWFTKAQDNPNPTLTMSGQYGLLGAEQTAGTTENALVLMVPLTGRLSENDRTESNSTVVGATYLAVVVLPARLEPEVAFPKLTPSTEYFVIDQNGQLVLAEAVVSQYKPTLEPNTELRYTDEQGKYWRAVSHPLTNGWSLVVQQTDDEVMAPWFSQMLVAGLITAGGWVILILLTGIVTRRSLQPIQVFADTARAVATGKLNTTVSLPGHGPDSDEFGSLAFAFNRMLVQVIEMIHNLDRKVQERTQALARRNSQFQAAAQVASESAQIRDLDLLLSETTELVSSRFEFYHTGIFIIDENGEFAVLRAANSQGGRQMLARQHKLRVAKEGIVGYVASSGVPRIALDVGTDAVFFNNPDLPGTRSEAALPLLAAGRPGMPRRVIGVLDVQSTTAKAFSLEDVEILQVVADQVALAIENARLFEESRRAYDELNRLYSSRTLQSWSERLRGKALAYRYDRLAVQALEQPLPDSPAEPETNPWVLKAPIYLRTGAGSADSDGAGASGGGTVVDDILGFIILRREEKESPWTAEERLLVNDALAQIIPALENARLLEEIQQSAHLDSLVGQISTRLSESLSLEHVMNRAVTEIGAALGANRVRIHLAVPGNGEVE